MNVVTYDYHQAAYRAALVVMSSPSCFDTVTVRNAGYSVDAWPVFLEQRDNLLVDQQRLDALTEQQQQQQDAYAAWLASKPHCAPWEKPGPDRAPLSTKPRYCP